MCGRSWRSPARRASARASPVRRGRGRASGAPNRAMVLLDKVVPGDAHVFLRGNPGSRGAMVPRRFLQVLSRGERKPFADGSGRLEVARAIASPDNPLTARVMVNRIWLQLFGQGLVKTPSDFGVRAELSSHPKLLDHLAAGICREWLVYEAAHPLIVCRPPTNRARPLTPVLSTVAPSPTRTGLRRLPETPEAERSLGKNRRARSTSNRFAVADDDSVARLAHH